MSRFHIHINVADLKTSIAFYSAAFGAEPTVLKDEYAKWQLEDPKINFAISSNGANPGVDHLGIQAESAEELAAMEARFTNNRVEGMAQEGTTCCYARSDKYWTMDPQGLPWESFHTLDSAPTFHEPQEQGSEKSCCAPAAARCC